MNRFGLLAVACCLVSVFPITSTQSMALEIDYKTLYKKASPAVVLIYAVDGKKAFRGAGSIIDGEGLVLTNTHVVAEKGKVREKL